MDHDKLFTIHEQRFSSLEKGMKETTVIALEANGRSKINSEKLDNINELTKVVNSIHTQVALTNNSIEQLLSADIEIFQIQKEQGEKIMELQNRPAITVNKVVKWLGYTIIGLMLATIFGIIQAYVISQFIPK